MSALKYYFTYPIDGQTSVMLVGSLIFISGMVLGIWALLSKRASRYDRGRDR